MSEEDSLPVFRAPKRRKFMRKPAEDVDDTPGDTASLSPTSAPPRSQTPADESHGSNVAEILRARKRPTHRISKANVASTLDKPATPHSTAVVRTEVEKRNPYEDRFIAQTGQVVHDKQMMAYIEARMAEKNAEEYGWPTRTTTNSPSVAATSSNADNDASTKSAKSVTFANTLAVKTDAIGNPIIRHDAQLAAGMGKLQEVDLGPDAAMKNIERTQAALRLARGEALPPEPEPTNRKARRRRRQEQARDPQAVLRDQLVEQVLREAKLDYYDDEAANDRDAGTDQATDEVLAERFRREFLESLESRNPRKPAPPPPQKGGAKEPPKPGRKMGGSRSARAAMRLQEEQAAKNKK
ncbi:hypothetical protein BCR34DRAFT_575230 [Clohesyomyces aquaticus]|uniref:Hepatocellular carcinoma-associated antigen 59-domain-containing protein n=1 Tax=Clohesyomyces aquaticus TaxID=1231657 RepID=A0A1Y1YST7_9PLEO|nr:hypothetical protein BCR34DRAFT_575230 [Clohesyomyces aquaticus]